MVLVVGASEATMNSLLTKLGRLLAHEYSLIRGVRGDIQYINDEMASMQAFLGDLSAVPHGQDRRMKDWMKQIRDVSYDIEDCVDDFANRLSHDPGGDVICCAFVVSRVYEVFTWWPRREIASNIAELRVNGATDTASRTRSAARRTPVELPVDSRLPRTSRQAFSLLAPRNLVDGFTSSARPSKRPPRPRSAAGNHGRRAPLPPSPDSRDGRCAS